MARLDVMCTGLGTISMRTRLEKTAWHGAMGVRKPGRTNL
jgi:hypothetical protein